jgi:hypothetical protein
MQPTTATVHVHGVNRERFLAALAAKLDAEGFDLCEVEPLDAPVLRRVVIRGAGRWCSLAEADVHETDTWGSYLARSIGAPVLGLFTWEDEATAVWTLYEDGKKPECIEPLRVATRGKDGRVRIGPGPLARWMRGAKRAAPIVLGVDEGEDGSVHVPLEDQVEAVARAIALPQPWIDPSAPRIEDGEIELVYRPRASRAKPRGGARMPLLPPRLRGPSAADVHHAAAYAGREFAVGWVGFDAGARARPAVSLLGRLVESLVPLLGEGGVRGRWSRDDVVKASGALFDPPGARRWCVEALASRGAVELEAAGGRIWAAHHPVSSSMAFEAVPILVGWSIRRPGEQAARARIAEVMDDAIRRAADERSCIGAIATAQGRDQSPHNGSYPYEELARLAPGGIRAQWVRGHTRSPGWRVIVPRAAVPAVRILPSSRANVRVEHVAAGSLVLARAADPFATGDVEALERCVLPTIGTEAELAAMLSR